MGGLAVVGAGVGGRLGWDIWSAFVKGTIFLKNLRLRFVMLLLPSILIRYESKPWSSKTRPVLVHLPGCLLAAWSCINTSSPMDRGGRVLVPLVSCSFLRMCLRARACSRRSACSLHSWRTVKVPVWKARWSLRTRPKTIWAGERPVVGSGQFRCWRSALAILSVFKVPPGPMLSMMNLFPLFTATSALLFERG